MSNVGGCHFAHLCTPEAKVHCRSKGSLSNSRSTVEVRAIVEVRVHWGPLSKVGSTGELKLGPLSIFIIF